MKETIIILLIFALFISISIAIYRYLIKVRLVAFILGSIVYLLFTYYLFDFFIYLHQSLRLRGIYLEFGHADLLLLETFAMCALMAVTSILLAIFKKYKVKRAKRLAKSEYGKF